MPTCYKMNNIHLLFPIKIININYEKLKMHTNQKLYINIYANHYYKFMENCENFKFLFTIVQKYMDLSIYVEV